MKAVVIMRMIPAVCLLLVAGPGWAELEDDAEVTLRLLEDDEGEEQVVRELSLPAEASEQGRISSAFGLATANAARRRAAEGDEAVEDETEIEGIVEGEGEEVERELIALPEAASDQARESAAFGLETANEARERGRELGQERAQEAREAAAERREEARLTTGQERAAEARERATGRGEAAEGRGRPDETPRGRPRD